MPLISKNSRFYSYSGCPTIASQRGILRSALTSGSCGCAASGSEKKINHVDISLYNFCPYLLISPLMDRCYILLSLILHDLLSFSQSFRFLTGYVAVKSLYCPYTISTYPVFSHHEQSKVCFLFFNRHCKIFNHLRTPNLPFLLLCSILFLYSLGVILYLSLKTRLKVL